MAGYSGTPLAKKLGLVEHCRLFTHDAPAEYAALIGPLAQSIEIVSRADQTTDMVHLFVTKKLVLARELSSLRKQLAPQAPVWVSWPKKSAHAATDITEDTIRTVALPLGFVDIKVCAVTDFWSALKLVVRKELR